MSSASAVAGLVCCRGRCCSDADAASGTDRGGLLLVLLLSLLPLPLLAEVDVVPDEELGPGEGSCWSYSLYILSLYVACSDADDWIGCPIEQILDDQLSNLTDLECWLDHATPHCCCNVNLFSFFCFRDLFPPAISTWVPVHGAHLQPARMGRRLLAGVACQRASARSSCRAGSGPPALHTLSAGGQLK